MPIFRVRRLVEFADTDMAGIVHFAQFFLFMEAAEHAYLRSCGLGVEGVWDKEKITFPRVSATCDYVKPIRFQDEIDIAVAALRIGRTSIRYGFTFFKGEQEIARGKITAVLCRLLPDRSLEPYPFPASLRERL